MADIRAKQHSGYVFPPAKNSASGAKRTRFRQVTKKIIGVAAAPGNTPSKNEHRGGSGIYTEAVSLENYERRFFIRQISEKNSHWSIAWSDLMMTMFIIFLVMFVYKTADREFLSGEGLGSFEGPEIGSQIDREQQDLDSVFEDFGIKAFSRTYDFSKLTKLEKELQDFARIDLAPDKTLRIILTGDLLFPLGSSEIRQTGEAFLRRIAVLLRGTPNVINIIGHTDNLPVRGREGVSNWQLSTNRAGAVVQFLIAETNLPPNQFYVTGHAEHRPAVLNNSPENRAKNRRVEIVVTKKMPEALPLGAADLP